MECILEVEEAPGDDWVTFFYDLLFDIGVYGVYC